MGTIQQAVFVERSTNPNCPEASQIIEALRMGDVDLAYEMALDTLKPRRSLGTTLKESLSGLGSKLKRTLTKRP